MNNSDSPEFSTPGNTLAEQSMDFAIEIVHLVRALRQNRETLISSQLGRSGTSIGANIREAQYAQSRADFIAKLHIALKEANETLYWLELLYRTSYLREKQYLTLSKACLSLIRMLTASLNTAKSNTPSAQRTP